MKPDKHLTAEIHRIEYHAHMQMEDEILRDLGFPPPPDKFQLPIRDRSINGGIYKTIETRENILDEQCVYLEYLKHQNLTKDCPISNISHRKSGNDLIV